MAEPTRGWPIVQMGPYGFCYDCGELRGDFHFCWGMRYLPPENPSFLTERGTGWQPPLEKYKEVQDRVEALRRQVEALIEAVRKFWRESDAGEG